MIKSASLSVALFLGYGIKAMVPMQQQDVAARVVCGADRLFTEYLHLVKGKKVALVANHSALMADGTHLVDTLFARTDMQLQVLFGAEFTIRSNDYSLPRDKEADVDTLTGLPKYSLYGHTHKPTREMLGDVDVIVFDMQGVGMRFFEHVNILGFVMEAASENGIAVVVLDRPNPLAGRHVDGFVTDEEFRYSFGSYASIPVCHGMTMAELAQLYNGTMMLRNGKPAKLQVVPMVGWQRGMWFDETGLAWKKPSPNLLYFSSILAYAGTCLFEGTNVSEGRGTDRPFEYIGAPWLHSREVVAQLQQLPLPGVVFEPLQFVPAKQSHLSKPPKYCGEPCEGIYVRVVDRDAYQPYKTGVALLWAIHKVHADSMGWKEAAIFRLAGTRRLKTMITDGHSAEAIFAALAGENDEIFIVRAPYLFFSERGR